MQTVRASTATLLEAELGTDCGAGHAHRLSQYLLCISSQMASQTTTTILTVAASLGTDPDAADVQIASHCLRCICRQEASQTNIVILTVLQNHSQHPSLLRVPAEQKPRHAAADVSASWSVSGSAWAGGLGLSHEKVPAGKAGINEALLLFPPQVANDEQNSIGRCAGIDLAELSFAS